MLRTAPPPQDAAPVRRALNPRACIADRLHTLGHPADLLTDDAVDEIASYASGSMARLRTALSSALFLAATEQAPRIDRSHVSRAIASLPQDTVQAAEPPAPSAKLPIRFLRPLPLIASGCIAALIVTVLLLPHKAPGPAPSASVQGPAPPVAARTDQPNAAIPVQQPSAAPPSRQASEPAPQALVPTSTQIAQAQPAAPAALQAPSIMTVAPPAPKPVRPAPLPAPSPATTTVVLRYRPTDQQAVDKLAFLTTRLKQGGYKRVFSYPLSGRAGAASAGSAIEYFYAQDRPAALAVVTAMGSESPFHAALRKPGKALHLMAQAKAEKPHPPGTVEAIIP